MATPTTPPEWIVAFPQGDYLRALRLLRAAPGEPESFSSGLLLYVLQAVGRFAEADAVQIRRDQQTQARGNEPLPAALRPAAQAERLPAPPETSPAEAAPLLRRAVAGHRLVIVGEEHPHPEHRAFGARLVPLLREAGITHLALETNFQAPLEEARKSSRVTPRTDIFSFEPQRAALLRAALAVDLPLVAVDMDWDDNAWLQAHPEDLFAYRERRMAEHIKERILEREPAARVLVWVGHQHAQKLSMGAKMMALQLWADDDPWTYGGLPAPRRW